MNTENPLNQDLYGLLYNWYAVQDARSLCPSGWHVPTDEEWMTMEMALGMSQSQANNTGFRGNNQGAQMKTTYGWLYGGNGTNSSGFSGLPGGERYENGSTTNATLHGRFWTSTTSTYGNSFAWMRGLYFNYDYGDKVNRGTRDPRQGFSVRCVQDAE